MCMLRTWPTKIPNMNKMREKTNDQLRTQDVRTDEGIPVYPPLCEWGYNNIYKNIKALGQKIVLLQKNVLLEEVEAEEDLGENMSPFNI